MCFGLECSMLGSCQGGMRNRYRSFWMDRNKVCSISLPASIMKWRSLHLVLLLFCRCLYVDDSSSYHRIEWEWRLSMFYCSSEIEFCENQICWPHAFLITFKGGGVTIFSFSSMIKFKKIYWCYQNCNK